MRGRCQLGAVISKLLHWIVRNMCVLTQRPKAGVLLVSNPGLSSHSQMPRVAIGCLIYQSAVGPEPGSLQDDQA